MRIALLIPTYNGGIIWESVLQSINAQIIQPDIKIIVDSGSNDNTVNLALKNEFKCIHICVSDFDHGITRQLLANNSKDCEFYIFLTQDAILCDELSISNIIKVFEDPSVGMAYGRQLPHKNARVLESHARLFNYPDRSELKSIQAVSVYGFKTIFCSNSFAAYRKDALMEVGGFPSGNIMGEDTIVAAKMILANWKVAYVADALVFHSHSYTIMEEFRRYFDIGVFHAQNSWLYKKFGKPETEGIRFVISEMKYAIKRNFFSFLLIFPKTIAKWLGFKIGRRFKKLPQWLIALCSMHKNYWK